MGVGRAAQYRAFRASFALRASMFLTATCSARRAHRRALLWRRGRAGRAGRLSSLLGSCIIVFLVNEAPGR